MDTLTYEEGKFLVNGNEILKASDIAPLVSNILTTLLNGTLESATITELTVGTLKNADYDIYVEDIDDFVWLLLDADERILMGLKSDGSFYAPSMDLSEVTSAIADLQNSISHLDKGVAIRNPLGDEQYEDRLATFASYVRQDADVESFLFMTDPHLGGSAGGAIPFENSFYPCMEQIKKFYDKSPTSFLLCGGDWLNSKDTRDGAALKLGFIDGYMRSHFDKYFPVFGNHDDNYQGSGQDKLLSQRSVRNLMFRHAEKTYYTFKEGITKFIVLDSGGDVYPSDMNEYARWEQLSWLGELLTQNTDEHLALAIHIYIYGIDTNSDGIKDTVFMPPFTQKVMDMMVAFNARTTYTDEDDQTITFNFANATGKVHFVIAGHRHINQNFFYRSLGKGGTLSPNGIPVVLSGDVRNEGVYRDRPSFDLVCADYTNNRLHMVRIGPYGSSRNIDMTTGEIISDNN